MVTMPLDTLLGGLESADLLTGHQLSPAAARRLACEAGIVPVVLGGDGEPLDYGRTKRFHTPAQRRLIFARDKTCRAEGCEIPANWCHVHHEDPWIQRRLDQRRQRPHPLLAAPHRRPRPSLPRPPDNPTDASASPASTPDARLPRMHAHGALLCQDAAGVGF